LLRFVWGYLGDHQSTHAWYALAGTDFDTPEQSQAMKRTSVEFLILLM